MDAIAGELKQINVHPLLAAVIQAAKERGHMGVAIWDQGGPCGHVACVLTRLGGLDGYLRSADPHPTPEAAVADLARHMGLK